MKQRKDDPQIRVQGTISQNSKGGELIVFSVPLGPMEIVCLANIPAEGDTKAPVYVKFKFVGEREDARPTDTRFFRRNFDEDSFDQEPAVESA